MKIIIDIGHPAHVHLFKYFAREMRTKGHTILFTARDKENEIYLLKKYQFPYKSFGKHYKSTSGKIFGLVKFNLQMLYYSLKFKPDLYLSHGSVYAAMVSWLLRKPHISMEDTGNIEQVRLYLPFTKVVLTSDIFEYEYGKKQIRYNSHHEIAYLHPNYFKDNSDFLSQISLKEWEPFVIIRFVAWQATHDSGQMGLKLETKLKIIHELEKRYKVLISSESDLPDNLKEYKLKFSPEDMHLALKHADLFIGEGTTMAMEAAILGTPAFYINSLQYANVKDMEHYGLLYRFENDNNLIQKIQEIISVPDLKKSIQSKKEKMLSEKIDLTAFLIWFVENYPESFRIMKEKPDYPYNFK
jgi:predicted glycosyltransferase